MEQRNKLTEKTWKLGAPSGKQSAFGCQPALRIFFSFHTKKEKNKKNIWREDYVRKWQKIKLWPAFGCLQQKAGQNAQQPRSDKAKR